MVSLDAVSHDAALSARIAEKRLARMRVYASAPVPGVLASNRRAPVEGTRGEDPTEIMAPALAGEVMATVTGRGRRARLEYEANRPRKDPGPATPL
jgi:hypothetical protein